MLIDIELGINFQRQLASFRENANPHPLYGHTYTPTLLQVLHTAYN